MAEEENKNEEQQTEEQVEETSDYEQSEKKKKKIIYIAIFAVQIIVAIVLVKFFIIPWNSGDEEEVNAEEQEQVLDEDEKIEIGAIYKLPSLTVNPKGSRGRRFAVFEIAFSIPEEIMVEEVKKYEPVLIDNFIQYFRSKTVADLAIDTVMSVIKNDVMKITIDIIGEDKVDDVYFTNFILQ